jgi:hypothetical protein
MTKTLNVFVLSQYERRRIFFRIMLDAARELGWIDRSGNQFFTTTARQSTSYAKTESSIAVA